MAVSGCLVFMYLTTVLLIAEAVNLQETPVLQPSSSINTERNDSLWIHRRSRELIPSKNSERPSSNSNFGENLLHDNSLTVMDDEAPLIATASGATFVTLNGTVVTAQRGSVANLPCEVHSLGDGVVTWIRRKDYHLLTVGHTVYSSDERFQVQGPPRTAQSQDWTLQIRFVQERDGGLYECQLSTHPPSSLFIQLNVVEAQAEIGGGPDKYVKSGSELKLICVIKQSSVPPVYVFWYHDGRMINYEGARGVLVQGDASSSTLKIARAQSTDSGNYTCVPSNVRPASVTVHILNGEKPAAMQHSSASTASPPGRLLLWLFTTLSTLCAFGLRSSSFHHHRLHHDYHYQVVIAPYRPIARDGS